MPPMHKYAVAMVRASLLQTAPVKAALLVTTANSPFATTFLQRVPQFALQTEHVHRQITATVLVPIWAIVVKSQFAILYQQTPPQFVLLMAHV